MPESGVGLKRSSALRALMVAAAVVVVVAGLDAAEDIILPILFSVFLSIATLPLVRGLQRLGVPNGVAIPIVVVLAAGVLVGFTSIIAGTARQFAENISQYSAQFNQLMVDVRTFALTWGLPDPADFLTPAAPAAAVDGGIDTALTIEEELAASDEPTFNQVLTAFANPQAVMRLVSTTVNSVVAVLGRVLIVLVTLTFILLEASELEQKVSLAFGSDAQPSGPFAEAGEKVTRYLLIKTIVSAITGVLAGFLCRFVGVDFWVMWGVVAFLLNYIPTIGSIVAAIPPMLLALVQLGVAPMAVLGVGYMVINVSLGNLIEPRLMGQSLGLSPLIVFLSLVFWGWLWGPVGMLLCVPLTVMAKLVLESNEDTRWLAVLLGSPRDVRRAAESPPSGPEAEAEAAK